METSHEVKRETKSGVEANNVRNTSRNTMRNYQLPIHVLKAVNNWKLRNNQSLPFLSNARVCLMPISNYIYFTF